jgi:predicted DCC family thiol-disulfide oxidoreductase YuxK
MKLLANKIIIYDDACPLCKTYTNGFIQIGWILPENRIGFSEASKELLSRLDVERARHEIPLFDTKTGETIYGKEALFFILGEQFPIFKPLFRFAPFRGLVYVLYQIITYNRRIIAGSKAPQTGFDCAPDFNIFYRWLYIGIATTLSVWLSFEFLQKLDNQSIVFHTFLFIAILKGFAICEFQQKTGYFGHLATVFLILSLLKIVLYSPLFTIPLLGFGIYLMWKRIAFTFNESL